VPWVMRHATSVVPHGPDLWLIAGSSTAVYNDVWRFTYAS
jgi:hypothetical protein